MFVFKAYDTVYQGLRGMFRNGVVDTIKEEVARDVAIENALYVLDDFSTVWESVQETADNHIEEGYDEDTAYEKAKMEHIEYEIYEIFDNCPFSLGEIEDLIYDDFEEFVEQWCHF